jgi:GT2 family glycosyltransferase
MTSVRQVLHVMPKSPVPSARSEDQTILSVIVVSWNTREILRGCLESLRGHLAALPNEVIVIDNGSKDGSDEMVRSTFPEMRLIANAENRGFGSANNQGMAVARGEFFLLINSDARLVDAGTPRRLVQLLRERPSLGVVGPRLVFEDGRLQSSANWFPSVARLACEELGVYLFWPRKTRAERFLGGYWDHAEEREVDWLVGACLMVRRRVFEETGGFDPNMFLYGEEVEWCHRIRERGWTILFAPVGEVVHLGHASAQQLLGDKGRVDYCLRAADTLVRRWEGPAAAVVAGALRFCGALIKLVAFSLRRLRPSGDDQHGVDVRRYARWVMAHYLQRLAGRLMPGGRRYPVR